MSNYTDIEIALIKAVTAVPAVASLPTGYPGDSLVEESKPDGMWVQLHNLRALTDPVTLGDTGEDNNPGLFQVDLNYPIGKGSGAILTLADAIATAFPAGRPISNDGQTVIITRTSVGSGRYVGGYYRVHVEIYYYSRTVRNP